VAPAIQDDLDQAWEAWEEQGEMAGLDSAPLHPDVDVDRQVGALGPGRDRHRRRPHRLSWRPDHQDVPELVRRDRRFDRITLRHLLTMRSDLRYEESGTRWSDDTATYYAPDLRAAALRKTEIVEEPERRFHYNNYNPLLGPSTSPSFACCMPMVEPGRVVKWSRAPGSRTRPSSPPAAAPPPPPGTSTSGELSGRSPQAFFARGKYAQHIYVVPKTGLVLVRFGRDFGYEK
jgi:CubicO group peptidase (beta-lactamase class C family)